MKIYTIDAERRLIAEAHLTQIYPDAKRLVGIGSMEAAYHWSNGDVLFVDDEGMLQPIRQHWFSIEDRADGQPLAGNAFVCGAELEGDQYPKGYTTLDPRITLDQLRAKIAWLTLDQAVEKLLSLDTPAVKETAFKADGSSEVRNSKSWRKFLTDLGYPVPDRV